jgi:diguanylate cyclase (GGDEF)-like protein
MARQLSHVFAWLRCARGRKIIIAAGAALGMILAAGTTTIVLTSRSHDLAEAERQISSLAAVVSEATDRWFATAKLVQTQLIDEFAQAGVDSVTAFDQYAATQAMNRELSQWLSGVPHLSFVALAGADGRMLNISRTWPAPAINISDRSFFQALSKNPQLGTFISEPVRNRETGAWSIIMAQAVTGPDGRFLGLVNVGVELASFHSFHAQIGLGSEATIGLFRRDGALLARFPQAEIGVGKTFSENPDFEKLLKLVDKGAVRRPSMVDGRERLIVPHSVAHFPLVVVVTNAVDATLADWRVRTWWLVGAAILTEVVLGGLIALSIRQLRNQELLNRAYAEAVQTEADLALAEAALAVASAREQHERETLKQSLLFDLALTNMVQGLLMVNGVGQVHVANRRLYELFGVPAECIPKSPTLTELITLIVGHGHVTAADSDVLRAWRTEMEDRAESGVLTWQLASGRALTVTHQPMEDGWLATYEDVTTRLSADAKMAHMAHHDALTDLPNRLLFRERLEQALVYGKRGQMLALLYLDLDQFKTVNDTLGHPVGDALLQAVAQRLRRQTREIDTVARLGGDEFAIIQTMIDKPVDATVLASRIIEALSQPFDIAGHFIAIGTSVGIAIAPTDGLDADVLLKNADIALYRAKLDGRGIYRLFQAKMDTEMRNRRLMEADLRQALPNDQLEIYYQPLMDLQSNAIGGFEALLRWRHPEKGLIPPDQFIPLAEEIGAIVPIGEWILRTACSTAASWSKPLKVAINLSPVQFKCRGLVAMIEAALRDAGLPAERLELEITESVLLEDTDSTLDTLHELRGMGVRIAMDDFGTGYSSLSYLRKFPFDRIKIDRSFVRELGQQRDSDAIIRAVLDLSQKLGIQTTAEGVETTEQLRALANAGCSNIQGYLFSAPVPGAEITKLMQTMPTVAELLGETDDVKPCPTPILL